MYSDAGMPTMRLNAFEKTYMSENPTADAASPIDIPSLISSCFAFYMRSDERYFAGGIP